MAHGVSVPTGSKGQADTAAARPPQQTVLLVEDDEELRVLMAQQLTKAGYLVLTAGDGPTMFTALNEHGVDLIVLDLNLPGEDGLSLCRSTRTRRNIPIIMVTARSEAVDRVIGLEVGADDYISKPFDPREFLARVRSVLRRTSAAPGPQEAAPPKRAVFRGWTLDFTNRRLTDAKGRAVILSGAEFSLLKFLVEHANQVLTREQLLTLTSHPASSDGAAQRVADLQISRLRQKLDDDEARATELIMTVRGQGYVLATEVTFE
jgi:two-component system, OmpR family, response regulator